MKKAQVFILSGMLITLLTGCLNKDNPHIHAAMNKSEEESRDSLRLASIRGMAVGGLLGRDIAALLDESDKSHIYRVLEHNATSEAAYWSNPTTGGKYMLVPESNWLALNGHARCRYYASTSYVNARKRHVHGAACLQSSGAWESVSR